jgi:vacuolar-type H+-ATPase subunit E/Vma4
MAIEGLLAHVDRSARRAADALQAAAREHAGRLVEAAERDVRASIERALAVRHDELERAGRARLADIERELRGRLLRAREKLIDRIFAEVLQRAPEAARSPRYRESLARRVAAALAYVAGDAVVACTPELVASLRGALAQAGSPNGAQPREVRVEADPSVGGGAIVRSADGSLQIDESLPAYIRREHARLAITILERLDAAP